MSSLLGTHARWGYSEGYEDSDGCATCASFGGASDRDLSTSSFDKLLGYPESYATSQISLGGEERFKDPCQVLLLDADPVILHDDLKPISRAGKNISRRDAERSSLAHGVHRVGDDVRKNLDQLAPANDNLLQVVELCVYGDASRQQLRVVHGKHVFEQAMNMDLHR